MSDPARPYYNDKTGQTVLMTDTEFNTLAPGHAYRRLQPGEVVPPATESAEVAQMEDDGAPHPEVLPDE